MFTVEKKYRIRGTYLSGVLKGKTFFMVKNGYCFVDDNIPMTVDMYYTRRADAQRVANKEQREDRFDIEYTVEEVWYTVEEERV